MCMFFAAIKRREISLLGFAAKMGLLVLQTVADFGHSSATFAETSGSLKKLGSSESKTNTYFAEVKRFQPNVLIIES